MRYNHNSSEPLPSREYYYIVYGRLTAGAVQMFLGYVTTAAGDNEFDSIAEQLDLKTFSYIENDFETAEELAQKDARKLHPSLPVEIRFMETGELEEPSVFLLPVEQHPDRSCPICQKNGEGLVYWRSACKWGHPLFCSQECTRKWYLELPFQTAVEPAAVHVMEVVSV